MAGYHASFSEMLFQACDSYLDVSACKQYTDVICNNNTASFSNEDTQRLDTREDYLTMRGGADGISKMKRIDVPSQGRYLPLPLLPLLDDDDEEDETTRRSADISKDIFRLKRSNNFSRKNDYAEFYKLCRCTAWSMDSHGSVLETSSSDKQGEVSVNLVHWDDILNESVELNHCVGTMD